MKKNDEYMNLLQDFLQNEEISSSDLKKLYKQYNTEKGNAEIKDLLDERWSNFTANDLENIDSAKILSSINKSIRNTQNSSANKMRVLYQWTIAAAAAVVIAVLVSSAFFFDVRLKNSEMAFLEEVIAPNGKIKEVELPDGTKVWLNPGSSLIYSASMTSSDIRDVRLWGQAFFEVTKDSKHPFVLQLGDIGLRVVGTSFNASNYKDDSQIEVALKTGQVNLFEGSYNETSNFVPLKPGQLAKYDKGTSGFKIEAVDLLKYTSWMNGVLIFRDDQMSDVFRRLERWYDVKIIVNDPKINKYLYTATIKNESLSQILELLEYTSQVKCELIKSNGSQAHKPTILIKSKSNN